MQVIVDFETYSAASIEYGAYKYTNDPSTRVVCMGYKIDDQPAKIWLPGDPCPFTIDSDTTIYAHNAAFDWLVWRNVATGLDPKGKDLGHWQDTMAIANRFGYPGGLSVLSNLLDLEYKKQEQGKALIRAICVPDSQGKALIRAICAPDSQDNRPRPYQAQLEALYEYCKADVEATAALLKALPISKLKGLEYELWKLTVRMNFVGLPVDAEAVRAIAVYLEEYKRDVPEELKRLTKGAVTAPTQVKRIKNWIATQGIELPNLTADTIAQTLQLELPLEVREVLEIRGTFGRTSLSKYNYLMNAVVQGRVHDYLQYYGAHTGRWAGRGFQIQNLPRAKFESDEILEESIESFKQGKPNGPPLVLAKRLIRSMIKAEAGTRLIVSDYSSIENWCLAYLSQDFETLDLFEQGFDQYKDMAAHLYKIDIDQVTEAQRQVGKSIILGCGYGMKGQKFHTVATTRGISLTLDEAFEAVQAYEDRYPKITWFWKSIHHAACVAVIHGVPATYGEVKIKASRDSNGTLWLAVRLPSNRYMYYLEPKIDEVNNLSFLKTQNGIGSRMNLRAELLAQNITQAVARDVMATGLLNLQRKMPQVRLCATVHDEVIGIIKNKDIESDTLDRFNHVLCDIPWLTRTPKATGYIAERYRKE